MRRGFLLLGLIAMLFASCCSKPLRYAGDVRMDGKLDMDADMRMDGKLKMDGDLTLATRMVTPLAFSLPALNGPVSAASIDGQPCSAEQSKIAIVDVDGPLINSLPPSLGPFEANSLALFSQKLDAIAATPGVKAVVLRINSPGGGVTVTELMHAQLQRFKQRMGLTVIASLLEVGSGGAYYLATAADQIFAHPTTLTGGIGTVINLYNLRETMAAVNVLDQSIKSGENIDMGSTLRAHSPEAERLLKDLASEFHDRFKNVVLKARPLVEDFEKDVFDGRILSGRQAKERGLVDHLGDLHDAIDLAKRATGSEAAAVVLYRHEHDRPGSAYSVTPSLPFPTSLVPASIPGLERNNLQRNQLPLFLYMWLPDPA